MEELEKKIENIICECDPDSIIDDEMLNKMKSELVNFIDEHSMNIEERSGMLIVEQLQKLNSINKYLEEIAVCAHEYVHKRM